MGSCVSAMIRVQGAHNMEQGSVSSVSHYAGELRQSMLSRNVIEEQLAEEVQVVHVMRAHH